MVEMIASMETYLRRGRRTCQRLLLNPKIRTGGVVLLCGGSGFLLSAASLGNYPQPLAMGLILAMSGWHAAVMSLGAMLGYWVFWGIAGLQGLVWSASGGLLALLLARHIPEDQPLIFPAISAFLTALTGLLFQLVLRDTVPVPVYFLRIVLAAGAGLLFPVALGRRTAVTDWLVGGVAVLAHPSVYHSMELARELIAAGRLDGVEINHPRNTPEDKAELARLAKENGLIVTGGTDYHGINTVTPRPVGAFSTSDEMIARIGDIAKARKATWKKAK